LRPSRACRAQRSSIMSRRGSFPSYTEAHVNAIRLVRELQSKRYLPLAVIKKLVKNPKNELSVDEVRSIAEMDGKLFKNLKESLIVKRMTDHRLAAQAGTSREELKALEKMGLLHPVKKNKQKYYDEDDIRFMECWKKMRKLGFSKALGFDAAVLKPHREMIEQLVEEEARIMLSRTLDRISVDEMVKMVEGGTQVLNTMIGLIHKRLIFKTVQKMAQLFPDQTEKTAQNKE